MKSASLFLSTMLFSFLQFINKEIPSLQDTILTHCGYVLAFYFFFALDGGMMASQNDTLPPLPLRKKPRQHKLLWLLLSLSLVVALGVWVTLQPPLPANDARLHNAAPYHISKPQRDPARIAQTAPAAPAAPAPVMLAERNQAKKLREQEKEMQHLQRTLAAQKHQIAELTETVQSLQQTTNAQASMDAQHEQLVSAMTMAQLYTALKQKLNDAESFAPELKALLALPTISDTAREKLAFLSTHAKQGVPSKDELRLSFDYAVRAYYRASALNKEDDAPTTLMEDVTRWTGSLITVRKIGKAHRDDSDSSIIARAETHVQQWELPLALEEIGRLSVHTLPYFKNWRHDAHTYLSTQEIVREIDPLMFKVPEAPSPPESISPPVTPSAE
jgi:hypothetical protein